MNFFGFDSKFETQSYFCIPRAFDSHVHLLGMGKFSGPYDLSSIKNDFDFTSKLNSLVSTLQNHSFEKLCYVQTFGLNVESLLNIKNLIANPKAEFCLVLKDGHSALFFGSKLNLLLTKYKTKLTEFVGTVFFEQDDRILGAILSDQGRQYFEGELKKTDDFKSSLNNSGNKTELHLLQAQNILLNAGFTHCRDMTSDFLQFESLLKLEANKKYFLYSDLYFSNFSGEDISDLFTSVKQAQKNNSNRIQVKGVKVFLDGSLGSHSLDSSCHHYGPSAFNFSFEDVKAVLEQGIREDINIAFHCIGDLAFEKIIKGFCALKFPAHFQIHLEHCEFINPETLKILKNLSEVQKQNLYFHFQPTHWTDDHLQVDPKSDLYFFAWDELFKLGFKHIYFGSDAPVTRPLLNLETDQELLPFLQSKAWLKPWWKFFINPEAQRSPNTFTLTSCAKTEQKIQYFTQVFIDGQLLKPNKL